MSEAKEKDRMLAEIKVFKPLNEIEGRGGIYAEIDYSRIPLGAIIIF